MFLGGRSLCGLVRFFDAGREPGCIPASVSTLAERLREAGYQTVGVVTNTLLFRPAGFDRGFDRWTELPGEPAAGRGRLRAPATSDVTQLAITQAAAQPEGRTFLYVHYMDAHDYALWDLTYRESVERADAAIGALIRDLDRTGWLANGLVIITSDHGQRLSESHLLPGTPGHLGNPSFEELLEIPIVVRPAILPRGEHSPMRSEDLFRLITTAAGLQDLPRSDLAPDELFLTETRFRTYRRGQWKSFWNRADDRIALVDLATDPHETRDESNQHPEIVAEHRARMAELARSLAGARNLQPGPTALERERLEALGYLEESRMQDETQ
jgi:arylsulfatase A-like enzyme